VTGFPTPIFGEQNQTGVQQKMVQNKEVQKKEYANREVLYKPVIGHGIGGKYIPIMARLAKARRWSKQ